MQMCDDGPCCDYRPEAKTEDVRATKPYRVSVTLLVDAMDADRAVTAVLDRLPGGSTVKYIQASEEEAGR